MYMYNIPLMRLLTKKMDVISACETKECDRICERQRRRLVARDNSIKLKWVFGIKKIWNFSYKVEW